MGSSPPTPDGTRPRGHDAAADPARPLLWFSITLVAACIALGHEALVRQPALYLAGAESHRTAGRLVALAAAVGAAWVVGRSSTDPRRLLGWLTIAASSAAGISGIALFFALASPAGFRPVVLGVPVVAATLSAATLVAAWRTLGRTAAGLGVVVRALAPFRLLILTLLFVAAAAAAARVGVLRTGLAIGMALAVCGAWLTPLLFHLERRPPPLGLGQRAIAFGIFAAEIVAFAAVELVTPASMTAAYANEIVHAVETDRQRYVVTSGQDAFELFVDGKLDVSTIDERRYHEALVHPAFAVAPRRARVLMLGTGDGLAEREVLRHDDVERVTVVTVDRRITELARSMPWLATRSEHAMESPRVEVVEREPAAWLVEHLDVFDVAVVDLPDPEGFAAGKYYTRWFYETLGERLSPDGVAVVQAVSPFKTPRTSAAILSTIRAAGLSALPYRAPVPTYGEWGFVLISRARLEPPAAEPPLTGATFLTPSVTNDLFMVPRDADRRVGAEPSTLTDQRVVGIFDEERSHLGL